MFNLFFCPNLLIVLYRKSMNKKFHPWNVFPNIIAIFLEQCKGEVKVFCGERVESKPLKHFSIL